MAVTFKNRPKLSTPEPPPPAPAGEYTILTALKEWVEGTKHKGETLMLIHNTTGTGYLVKSYDPVTSIAVLKGSNGQRLEPKITERECALYHPLFR